MEFHRVSTAPTQLSHGDRRKQAAARLRIAWFMPGALVFLYLLLFILLRTPIFTVGDQSIYLLNAARVVRGEVIYRDFFQFTPPGTEMIYATLFRLFGVRAWVPETMLVLLGASLAGLAISITDSIIRGRSVLLPGILFLVIPFRNSLDATHHWYSTLAVIAALRVVIEWRDQRHLAARGKNHIGSKFS